MSSAANPQGVGWGSKHPHPTFCVVEVKLFTTESLKFKSLIKTIALLFYSFIFFFGSASDLFSAGTETPSTEIIWGLFYAIKYPDGQARLHRELDDVIGPEQLPELSDRPNLPYLEAFLTEMVRIVSEIPLAILHLTMRDTPLQAFISRGI